MPYRFQTIVHPTDFSDLSAAAFAHALRIALLTKSRFYLVHIAESDNPGEYDGFPHVRQTLQQWGILQGNEPPADVAKKLGITVAKIGLVRQDPLRGLVSFLDQHPTDLIISGTHGRDGIAHWLQGSIAEELSRTARVPTLFLPPTVTGFVEQSNGGLHLSRVLMPVDHTPPASDALQTIEEFTELMNGQGVTIELMHVGETEPKVRRAADSTTVPVTKRTGDVVSVILQAAQEQQADLIAMPTAGHHGFLDAMHGSTTERVMRHAPCPVLAVPAAIKAI